MEIIDKKVPIHDVGEKRFAMFHIFVISVGYLAHKWVCPYKIEGGKEIFMFSDLPRVTQVFPKSASSLST